MNYNIKGNKRNSSKEIPQRPQLIVPYKKFFKSKNTFDYDTNGNIYRLKYIMTNIGKYDKPTLELRVVRKSSDFDIKLLKEYLYEIDGRSKKEIGSFEEFSSKKNEDTEKSTRQILESNKNSTFDNHCSSTVIMSTSLISGKNEKNTDDESFIEKSNNRYSSGQQIEKIYRNLIYNKNAAYLDKFWDPESSFLKELQRVRKEYLKMLMKKPTVRKFSNKYRPVSYTTEVLNYCEKRKVSFKRPYTNFAPKK